ncbi:MAG TPA: ABC transporter [Sulfurospirillum arcachonense]|nr:ABC transporter [Sulfurospirillum arcachonense]HIP45311.1 ABC transporter [Sulfurospirillum arcachonense]
MRYIVLIALLLFTGCSIKDVEIKPSNYRLEPNYPLYVEKSKDDRVLRVQRVEGDSAVMTRSILYKKDGALKPYKYGRWSELPSTRLQEIFIESIEKQKIFRATVSSRSYAMADLILESNLENFEEVYDKDKPYVQVKIRFRLIERQGAEIVGSVLIDSLYPVEQKEASGVVLAFNKAVEKVVIDLIGWLNEQR